MLYRELGRSGVRVSALAMGCWALADAATWGPQSEADSIATVHAALDLGIDTFDTAEGYGGGESEVVLGRALRGRREQVVIATKVSRSNLSAESVRQACEDSLARLGTDYIDLYQVHWPSRSVLLEETLGALEDLQDEGKVRAVGVCNFGVGDLSELAATAGAQRPVVSNQLPYSLLWRAVEYEIRPACVDAGLGILCYSPLSQGLLTGKYRSPGDVPEGRARTRLFSSRRPQARHGEPGAEEEVFRALVEIEGICDEGGWPMASVALAWLLQQPGVTSVIAGARTPDQIRQTAQAADLNLAPETVARLSAATDEVKHLIGPNADMWQSESRFR
ncbi:MAG: aldo/keto reductase [Anaerolineae bacterium]|jgi:aryl-alcohol dehydrogenase-like predicted oxidoreductase